MGRCAAASLAHRGRTDPRERLGVPDAHAGGRAAEGPRTSTLHGLSAPPTVHGRPDASRPMTPDGTTTMTEDYTSSYPDGTGTTGTTGTAGTGSTAGTTGLTGMTGTTGTAGTAGASGY